MKTSKTDRKKYFDELGEKVSHKTENRLSSLQSKLSVKQIKRLVLGMFLFAVVALGIGIVKIVSSKNKNPFKEVNELSKSLVTKDSISLYKKGSGGIDDLLFLLEAKSQIEQISKDSITAKDSLKLVEINRKLDKLMKK